MKTLGIFLLFLGVEAYAATISTNLTVNATGALSATTGAFAFSGTANLTNIGSGTFTSNVSLANVSGSNISAPFTITLSGNGGTITGTILVPSSLLTGATSGTGSATITGGTGTYAGATGSFPALNGTFSGSIATSLTVAFSGPGTVVTGGGGGLGPAPAPTITAVLDAASNTPTLAPGSIFIVKGSNLCPSGTNFYNVPRPTVSSDGVKITFAPSGGAGIDALIWYTYNPSGTCQLAAILPSSTASGSYNVTVTSGSVSAPFATTVVATKPALFTQDSTGTGLASVQNYISATVVDLNSFTTGAGKGTTISPAKPGQVLQAYGTGLGGVAGQDNVASPVYDFSTNGATVRAIVGGRSIPVAFAGRAGYAGEDQINIVLPPDVQTGCTVPFQLSVNGVLSNATFIAIAPDVNAAACVAPGFTADQLRRFDLGGTYNLGYFGLTQITQTVPTLGTIKFNTASGGFYQFSGFQLASGSAQTGASATTPGTCQVTHTTNSGGAPGTCTPISYRALEAGNVTLNGPPASSISNRLFTKSSTTDTCGNTYIAYTLPLASEGLPVVPGVTAETGTIVAGTYTLSGTAGKDVGAFNGSITVATPLTVTGGLPATVNRSAGLTINWTGGAATDLVQISGGSSTRTGTGSNAVTDTYSFTCYTTAAQKTFTVPASILTQLPAIALTGIGGGGSLQVVTTPDPFAVQATFTAPLTAGGSLDNGLFFALIGVGATVAYQ